MSLDWKSRARHRVLKLVRSSSVMPSIGRYNITVSDRQRFLWFRVAKVCTRSILTTLERNKVSMTLEHPMLINYPINDYTDYFKFAFVRNPWDRLVSCWQNKIVDRDIPAEPGVVRWDKLGDGIIERFSEFGSFVEYVAGCEIDNCDIHFREQSSLIDLNNLNFLGRYESFDTDIRMVFDYIGIADAKPAVDNASQSQRPYQNYYNQELIDLTAKVYRKDIQIFNYQF